MSRRKTNPSTIGCGGKGTGKFCSGEDRQLKTYGAIVRHYRKHYQPSADSNLQFYTQLPTLDEALRRAAYAETANGKRNPHQYRLKKSNLKKVHDRLKRRNLADCATFHELFEMAEEAIGDINGIGELMVYDTAHRLGAYLKRPPEKVYLHAGVRVGAAALGFEKSRKWLEPAELPKPFQQLTAQQMEDCLCIYKHDLQAIPNKK
ncbi:hypothetical protein [Bremerella cremea]|uniref:hypothetical protein n=1 Tax=Bremerella cremea TaxID=1031537 RepID=UPI0031E8686B